MGPKRLKDPIYGYVEIDEEFVHIIDSAGFQRLRRVCQTSYGPLYASATHNRFVHSIGVFHLGSLAVDSLESAIHGLEADSGVDDRLEANLTPFFWEKTARIFRLACLLHDFGHAPFSHLGENFYLAANHDLSNELANAVGNDRFSEDRARAVSAAPHEIMSALASLETFPNMFADKEEKDLFARCITGYQYQGELGYEDSIRNIIISLLNSSTIDVDKLDYLIRDSFVSGYDSVQIDYERLLSGITVLPPEGRLVQYRLAYNKTALGILENVIYARDFEREWVQAHPVIMYEAFLLQHAMRQAQKHVATRGARLFSKEALTEKGVSFSDSIDELNENRSIRLLSDDDLYYLTKNEVKDDPLIYELYCRASRRHPIWKSEAEYQAIKNLIGTKPLEHLERILLDMEERLIKEFGAAIIERSTLEALQDMIDNKIPCSEILDEKEKRAQINDITDYIKICEALLSFEREGEVEPSYAIISVKHFKSGFYGSVLGDTLVAFPHIKRNNGKNIVSYKLSEVCPLLSRDGQVDSNFFYLYYRRGAAEKEAFPLRSFVKMLSDLASQLWG